MKSSYGGICTGPTGLSAPYAVPVVSSLAEAWTGD